MSTTLERGWYEPPRSPLLWSASKLFGLGVRMRTTAYERGWLRSLKAEGVRVISVGNLNVGGTGKTPAIIHLANRLLAEGRRVAILSRGYGRKSRADVLVSQETPAEFAGDEPRLIKHRCPQAHVLVGAQRSLLALRARDELGAQVILLDDGFQHRQLQRDADILVVDEAVGFGNGHLLPLGPLREPLTALSRASLIWLKETSGPKAPLPFFQAPVVRVRERATVVLAPDGTVAPAHSLQGQRVVALAAIARPERFEATLRSLGADVIDRQFFGDHQPFHPSPRTDGARLVTTEKDQARNPIPGAWTLRLETEPIGDDAALSAVLQSAS